MRQKIIILINLLFLFLLISCETTGLVNSNTTDIDEFYHVIKNTTEIPEECKLVSEEEPKIYSSNNFDSDFYFLRSIYYYPIGYAFWNGTASSVNDIEKNAKKLCKRYGATLALYTYEYTNTRNGWTQYGSYSIDRYDCTLYLFVSYEKSYIQMPKIGIEWRDLDSSDRLSAQRNTGAYISIIYEKSPAFYANLSKGDIITEINGYPIIDSDSVFTATALLESGSIVTLKYLRNGTENTVTFTIY